MAVISVIAKNISNQTRLITIAALDLDPLEEQELIGLLTVEQIAKSQELSEMLAMKVVSLKITRDTGYVRLAQSDGFVLEQEFYFGDEASVPTVHLPLTLDPLNSNGLVLITALQKLGLNLATTLAAGAMSAADKLKLDTISGGREMKAGRILATAFTGNPKKATVTFSTAFTANDYGVAVVGHDARSWRLESVAAGSFVINAGANQALTGVVLWTAIEGGESIE